MRQGFNTFLSEVRDKARVHKIGFSIILCGSRSETFKDFERALIDHPDAFNLLLVDAENSVLEKDPRNHLQKQDGWNLSSYQENQCHLMVQTMETWLIADIRALKEFYGAGFKPNSLPKRRDIENIDKAELEKALKEATKNSKKGEYHKTRHASELLQKIEVGKVRKAAPYCERLFQELLEKLIT